MPDIPRGTSTNASVALGDTFTSDIGFFGDEDWIRIDVNKGDWIQVDLWGQGADPLEDPFLSIYDKDRLFVTDDDDSGTGFNSQVTFQATKAGPYYIEAAGFFGDYTGDYAVKAQKITPPSAEEPLYWGTQLPDPNVSVYFAEAGEEYDGYTSEGWTEYEIEQFDAAFAMIEAVSGLRFTITNDPNADFRLVLDTNEIPTGNDSFLGYFNPPEYTEGGADPGVGVFNGNEWSRNSGGSLREGGFGFVTIVHELLHGLGLAHPHDDGGGSTIMPGVGSPFDDYGDFGLNQGIFTTMSYNSGYFTGTTGSAPVNSNYGYEAGPMALDIAVLQALYGTGTGYATGNSSYALANSNAAGTMWRAIWDTGGTDTITYNGNRDTTIDLRAATLVPGEGAGGYVSAAKGIAGGFTIAHGVTIENAQTANGDDTLTGNGIANTLSAGRGDDTLKGRAGNDKLNGGNGWDELRGGDGNDNLQGSGGRDRLYGDDQDDVLNGGNGKDALKGGRGADMLNGGDGNDTLKGGGGADTLQGGRQADKLIGGGGVDKLSGGAGADIFDFNKVSSSSAGGANRDKITDFGKGGDQINVKSIDANSKKGGNQKFEFIGNDKFSEAGQLRVVKKDEDRLVQADRNGDGKADFEILLLDTGAVGANDFIL